MVSADSYGTSLASSASTTTSPQRGTTTNTTEKNTSRGGGQKCSRSHVDKQASDEAADSGSQAGYPACAKEASAAAIPCTKALPVSEAPFADEVAEPWMSVEDLKALRRKVEWYFSDANLSTDQVLHHKISQHLPEGWLCVSEMMALEPLRNLGATPELLLKCLRSSHLETKVTLTADELRMALGKPQEFGKSRGVFVRRRQPLPPLLSHDRLHLRAEADTDPSKFVLVDRHQTMNRLKDLWRVERTLNDLNEVGDDTTVFRELILPNVSAESRPPNNKPVVFAVGYERVVYGDHGPYIEFHESQIRWKAWPHYFDKKKYNSYFDEYYTRSSHSIWDAKWRMWDPNASKGVLMLYAQNRSVSDRAWAPGAASYGPHCGRATGYADYRPGYFYLTADAAFISVEKQESS